MKVKSLYLLVCVNAAMVGVLVEDQCAFAQTAPHLSVLLPLSGNGADQAEWSSRGIKLAVDELASRGEKLDLDWQDTNGDPRKAVDAFAAVRMRYRLAAVLTWGSGVAMAIAPLANRESIIQMGIATGIPKYSTPNDFNYRMWPLGTAEAEVITAEWAKHYAGRRIAVLYLNNDYGQGILDALEKRASENKVEIGDKVELPVGDTDFRLELNRLKSSGVEVVAFALYPNEGSVILREMDELKWFPTIFSTTALLREDRFSFVNAPGAKRRLLIPMLRPLPDHPFTAAYKQRYADVPGAMQYALLAYDGAMAIGHGLSQCRTTVIIGDCLRNFLDGTVHPSSIGAVRFNTDGDAMLSPTLQEVYY